MFQITETYAFLPREAVTRFLLGCTECQRRPRSPSPAQPAGPGAVSPLSTVNTVATTKVANNSNSCPAVQSQTINGNVSLNVLATPSSSPTLMVLPPATAPRALSNISPVAPPPTLPVAEAQAQPPLEYYGLPVQSKAKEASSLSFRGIQQSCWENKDINHQSSQTKLEGPLRTSTPEPSKPHAKRSSHPLDVCNLTSSRRSPSPSQPSTPPKKRHLISHLSSDSSSSKERSPPKLWSPVDSINSEQALPRGKNGFPAGEIDYSLPITTTYLKYMRSLGCTDEDALKFEKTVSDLLPFFFNYIEFIKYSLYFDMYGQPQFRFK